MGILNYVLQYLVPLAVNVILQYGVPALEQQFPSLVPLINAILGVLKGGSVPAELHSASDHYNALVSLRK
jgi:hypothetical protein